MSVVWGWLSVARGTTADRTVISLVCSSCVIYVLLISNLPLEEWILGDLLKLFNTTAQQSPTQFSSDRGFWSKKKGWKQELHPPTHIPPKKNYKIGNALPLILLDVFSAEFPFVKVLIWCLQYDSALLHVWHRGNFPAFYINVLARIFIIKVC